jgi:hypothetical protein
LSGILSLAAAIKIDGGYKPANKLVATLKSIEKDPSLILSGSIEPEALAARREAISAGKRSRVRFGLTSTAPPMRRCLTHDA